MEPIKITAGRHHAWFGMKLMDGTTLIVRRPYIPPEGCHEGCGLKGAAIRRTVPETIPEVVPEIVPVTKPKLSWWARLVLFIKRIFKG